MFRSTMAAASIMFGGMFGGGTLAQTAGGTPFDWSTLVGGAIGSSPAAIVLAWRLNKADRELTHARDEIRDLHSKTLEVANRMAPILDQATRTLLEVRSGMEATISRPKPQDAELARVLERLQDAVDDLARRRRGDT